VMVDLRTWQATGHRSDTLASIEHIDGGEGSDTLIGNGAINEIDGFGGDDHIEGRSGGDLLKGGRGTDSINGGRGRDLCRHGETVLNCEQT